MTHDRRTKEEIRRFLMQGTFTGKLATVKEDGSSHVVPIWFAITVVDVIQLISI